MADPTPPGPTDDGNSDAQSLDFMGRVALVTGASRGIGRATVHALADRGAHVVAVARRVAALEELDDELRAKGREITLLQVDLKRGDKIDAIGPSLYQRWGKLDVLASCAGVLGPLSPLNHTQAAVWNECMTVNATANWHLMRTCEPLLRISDAGRAAFLTCGVSASPKAYWGAQAASKAALDALTLTFAAELQKSNVCINAVDPGPTRTQSRARAFPGEDPMTLPSPDEIAGRLLPYLSTGCRLSGTRITLQPS